jgi:Flp pilus assembly protein TadB
MARIRFHRERIHWWLLPLLAICLVVPVVALLGAFPFALFPLIWAPTFTILVFFLERDRRRRIAEQNQHRGRSAI